MERGFRLLSQWEPDLLPRRGTPAKRRLQFGCEREERAERKRSRRRIALLIPELLSAPGYDLHLATRDSTPPEL